MRHAGRRREMGRNRALLVVVLWSCTTVCIMTINRYRYPQQLLAWLAVVFVFGSGTSRFNISLSYTVVVQQAVRTMNYLLLSCLCCRNFRGWIDGCGNFLQPGDYLFIYFSRRGWGRGGGKRRSGGVREREGEARRGEAITYRCCSCLLSWPRQ